MKISYDKATDSLYIHLSDRASVDSDEVKDGVVLDFDANGALVGIDVQHASQRADIHNLSVSHLPPGVLLAARGEWEVTPSKTTRPRTTQDRVVQALTQAAAQAKKQLKAQRLKLPTQSWTGSAVRNPVV